MTTPTINYSGLNSDKNKADDQQNVCISPVLATLNNPQRPKLPQPVLRAHGLGGTVVGYLDVTLTHTKIFPVRLLCRLVGLPVPSSSSGQAASGHHIANSADTERINHERFSVTVRLQPHQWSRHFAPIHRDLPSQCPNLPHVSTSSVFTHPSSNESSSAQFFSPLTSASSSSTFHTSYAVDKDRQLLVESILGGLLKFSYQQTKNSAIHPDASTHSAPESVSAPQLSRESSACKIYNGFEGICRRATIAGMIPLPVWLLPLPWCSTRPHADGLGWDVRVILKMPFLGPIVSYSGPLRVAALATGCVGSTVSSTEQSSPVFMGMQPQRQTIQYAVEELYKSTGWQSVENQSKRTDSDDGSSNSESSGDSNSESNSESRTTTSASSQASFTGDVDQIAYPSTVRGIPSTTWAKVLGKHVLVFDGVCVMCNGIVSWLLAEDIRDQIIVSASSNPLAQQLLQAAGEVHPELFHAKKNDSIIVMDPFGRIFTESDAAVEILRALGGQYELLAAILNALPKSLRDDLYIFVGQHRYAVFGKKDACSLPSLDQRQRFL